MTLVWVGISWLVGIIATDALYQTMGIEQPIALTPARQQQLTTFFWALAGSAVGGVVIAILGRALRDIFPIAARLSLVGVCLTFVALGGIRYHRAQTYTTPHSVWLLAGQGEVTLQGVIHDDPKQGEDRQQILIEVEAARLGGASSSTSNPAVAIDGKVMIHAPPYPAYRYGQRVIVQGEVERPPAAEYPGWFDYRAFLARQAIFAIMDETEKLHITAHPTQAGNPALRLLYQFRAHCQEVLLRELPEPQASLAVGILLGGKAAIPDEVYDDFSAAGIAHILVISGWHLTLVATMLQQFLRTVSGWMPVGRLQIGRWTTFWIVIVVLWGYAFFVGGGIAALRAAVMASLAALATATERQAHAWIGLSVACWALTMLNPHVLWQIGFQLSVAATASIFAFNTPITAWLQGKLHMVEGVAGAVEILATTLAVHVLLLPVILYHFGNLAIIAPLANLAIVPVVPYAMILGALALGMGLLWLPLGQGIAALLAWLPLAWMSEGAHFFASLPWATVRLPSLSLWWIGGYYTLVGGWRIRRLREEET